VLTRSIARAVALAATVLAAAWAAVLIVVGGFEIQIGSWRLSSHQPMRPILWGTLPLAIVSSTAASPQPHHGRAH
jgi:hypothetical protein